MKSYGKKFFKVFCLILAVIVMTTAAFLLCACNDGNNDNNDGNNSNSDNNSNNDNDNDSDIVSGLVYSQSEHIGWENSLANFNKSAYSDYYSNGEPAFLIPGLNQGENFVLQGIGYSAHKNMTFLCGYINPETERPNSVVFVIDMNKTVTLGGGKSFKGAFVKELFLQNSDGSVFKGHAGGIAVTEKNVWISNGKKLYSISLDTIESAPASSDVKLSEGIKVPVSSSYCSYSDGVLWVGEFEYAKDNYNTDASHHHSEYASLTAWTVGYRIDESGKDGYDTNTGFKLSALADTVIPDYVLWHGQKVQGMAHTDGKIVLSTSYGRKNDSALYIYASSVGSSPDTTVEIGGTAVPCYLLLNEEKKVVAPPMTEDLTVIKEDGKCKVLVATESGAYYYHGYNFISQSKNAADFIWKYTVE